MDKPGENLTLQISTQLDAELAARAVREGKTKAEIVTAALDCYLNQGYLHQDDRTTQALAQLEQVLVKRMGTIETKITSVERQLIQSNTQIMQKDSQSNTTDLQSTIAYLNRPHSMNSIDNDEIEDEPDEILEDFLPAL